MGTYCAAGDVIEGLVVDCQVRCWNWKGLKKHPLTGKRMTLYTTDRNSDATVRKTKPEYDDENIKEQTKHFHRIVGDTLKADALSVYIDKLSKIQPEVKEGISGRHGAQLIHSTWHTIAEIRTPLDNARKRLGMTPIPPALKR